MKIQSIFILIAFSMVVMPSVAQETKIFRGDEVTESALIEALAPIRARSFKVFRDQPEPIPSASILIVFHTNSAELTAEAKKTLNVVGRAFNMDKLADFHFIIEGHTDPRGGLALNQHLSQARAESVLNYLIWNFQIDERRLTAIGRGFSELLNLKDPKAQENRRVTIVRCENENCQDE